MKTPRPLQAAVLLSALYFCGRLTGLLQTSIINALLPPSAADAYWAAFAIPDFVNYLVAGGALSITFIPLYTELLHRDGDQAAAQFFSTLTTMMGGILILLVIVSELATPWLVAIFRSGFIDKPEIFDLTVSMTRIILPAQIFFYVGGLLVGVLNAHKRFAASGWTGALYNVVAIALGLFLWWRGFGPLAFAWGILLGALVGNYLLPLLAVQRGPKEQHPRFELLVQLKNPAVRKYFLNALPIMIGVSLPVVDQLIVTWFASFLPVGALAHIATANRVMIAAQGILGQAASVAAFPYMADSTAVGDWLRFSSFIRRGLRRLMFLSIPLGVLLTLTAVPIITLLFGYGVFEHGNALAETSASFAFFCIGLFAWVGQAFISRAFYALKDTFTPTLLGSLLTIFMFIPMCWFATHFGGAWALALVTSIGATAQFIVLLWALENRLSSRTFNAPLKSETIGGVILRTITACVIMGIAGLIAEKVLFHVLPHGKLGSLFEIIGVWIISIASFGIAAHFFEIPEWSWLLQKLRLRRI
ncbi:MAG: murein biosynthesis integral membrane protein MurJ [Abditibacteriaceae bacterium]